MLPEPARPPIIVLLVEDNPDHAELVMRNFADHPEAQIQHISDGEAALDYLFRRGIYRNVEEYPQPHVILLDLRLPKIDGLEVLKKIRDSDELSRIPVVILTTSHADPDVDQAYRSHVNSYLVKPVDYDAFADLMNDLGCYWLDWNQYPSRAANSRETSRCPT